MSSGPIWPCASTTSFTPDLAASLHKRAGSLADLGRFEEAATTVAEAVETYRRLSGAEPGLFLFDLMACLHNLALWLGASGRFEEALDAITEATEHRDGLTSAQRSEIDQAMLRVLAWLRTVRRDGGSPD
jgi:tetratricopeptide (TPR) repeat protein